MQLARVVGSLVSTRKSDKLEGMKILVAVPVDMDTFEEKGAPFVTIDAIGAGEGEVVMCVGGSSSRQTETTEGKPVDNTIVAIIDSVDVLGQRLFDKAGDIQKTIEASKPQTEDVVAIIEETVNTIDTYVPDTVMETVVAEVREEDTTDNSFERVRESRRERSKKKNK